MTEYRLIKGFRQVDPVEARMGVCLETYECNEAGFQGLKRGLIAAHKALERHQKQGEIVYTQMNNWGKSAKHDVWQIYFISKG